MRATNALASAACELSLAAMGYLWCNGSICPTSAHPVDRNPVTREWTV
jgi:hypothetical protein